MAPDLLFTIPQTSKDVQIPFQLGWAIKGSPSGQHCAEYTVYVISLRTQNLRRRIIFAFPWPNQRWLQSVHQTKWFLKMVSWLKPRLCQICPSLSRYQCLLPSFQPNICSFLTRRRYLVKFVPFRLYQMSGRLIQFICLLLMNKPSALWLKTVCFALAKKVCQLFVLPWQKKFVNCLFCLGKKSLSTDLWSFVCLW